MTSLILDQSDEPVLDEPVLIVDYAVGATTVDLLIEGNQWFTTEFEKSKNFKRNIVFNELPKTINSRHFQAHIGKLKFESDLRLVGEHGNVIPYQVHESLMSRPRRTRITSSPVSGSRCELVLSPERIALCRVNSVAQTVSQVSVFNGSIVIELSKIGECELKLVPRLRKAKETIVQSDRSGNLTISKTWLGQFNSFDESLLFNIVDSTTGERLRHENPEIGPPRELFTYSAMKYSSNKFVASLRPYWTTDGYLSLKVVVKQAAE